MTYEGMRGKRRPRCVLAFCATLLIPAGAFAGALDLPVGGASGPPRAAVFSKPATALQTRRLSDAPRRTRRAAPLPSVKVESPTYYDFQPESLGPVDFAGLKPLAQAAVARPQPVIGPPPAAVLPAAATTPAGPPRQRVSCWLIEPASTAPTSAAGGAAASCF